MSNKIKMINIAKGERNNKKWHPLLIKELNKLGELTLIDNGDELSSEEICKLISKHDIAIAAHSSVMLPKELVAKPGKLKYVCNLHGTVKVLVSKEIIEADNILVSNWGDSPSKNVAESAMTLTLAVLKDLRRRINRIENGGWHLDEGFYGGTLLNLNVGVYGAGVIGRRYIEMLKVFKPNIKVFDPYAKEIPKGCVRVNSLEELFTDIELVSIHAGLTDETRGSVTKELLSMLPKYGVVINTARGAIIDQDALFLELKNGRLRAGLDVTVPEVLDVNDPARKFENLILTSHSLGRGWPDEGKNPTKLSDHETIMLDNIKKYINNEEIHPKYIMDIDRYNLST